MGTLDELNEALTLIQTKKILHFPVVLMGATYWRGFLALLEDMVKAGTVSAADLKLFLVTDSLDEAIEHIRKHAIEEFKLMKHPPSSRRGFLREDVYPRAVHQIAAECTVVLLTQSRRADRERYSLLGSSFSSNG